MPLSSIRVVRGRDHHAEVGAQRAGQHGDGRRRQRAEQRHVHAGADEAGGQRRLDHVAGQPRVLADHHAVAVVAAGEQQAGGLAQAQRDLRGHRVGVGLAADAVGAEQAPRLGHAVILRSRSPACSRRNPAAVGEARIRASSRTVSARPEAPGRFPQRHARAGLTRRAIPRTARRPASRPGAGAARLPRTACR